MINEDSRSFETWLIPVVVLAICVASFWITTGFDRMPPILKRGIQPSDFPQLIAGFIAFLTFLMVVFDPIKVESRITDLTWLSLGLMGMFAAITFVDFFLALAVFAILLARTWGERRPLLLATIGIVVPTVVFLAFDILFRIRFPRGLLTSLWYG